MIKANIKKQFNYSVEKLWDIITDNTKFAWRSDIAKIEIIDNSHFVEYTKNNYPTYFTITFKEEFQEYHFDLENTNIKGRWIGIFKKLPNGWTELNLSEEVEVKKAIMKLLAKPYLKSQQKRYLKDLEKALDKNE